jgi:hypothetical protein
MNSRFLHSVITIGFIFLVLCTSSLAQNPNPVHFRGSINDYTPANVGGPWQISGTWSLDLMGASGQGDFSAALVMVRSDMGVLLNGGATPNLNLPAQRSAHTHHITLVGGNVVPLTNGFRVTGAATITGNGNFPPPFGGSSTVQIDIIGGNSVTYSNIKVTFMGDAAAHFGAQAVNGVVRSAQ